MDDVRPPFHPPMYPINGESDFGARLTLTYLVESDPSKPTYPFVIRLTSDSSSSSAASRAPPLVHGRGFIRTCVVPRECGRAHGGGCGYEAIDGFQNGYL